MFREDKETFAALNALHTIVNASTPPLVIWLGAGVSAWAGYPVWKDIAATMHARFSREVSTYNKHGASRLLEEAAYPQLFQEMKTADSALYFNHLKQVFSPKRTTPVYVRLLNSLKKIPSVRILTTNIDETLEKNLPLLETVQRSDIARIPQLLSANLGFIAKLHGSISSVETIIFSTQDYRNLETNQPFSQVLRAIFSTSTVLFLGYGLQDKHVIRALEHSSASVPLFGSGPHFVVTPTDSSDLPTNVKCISYIAEHPDHRSSLQTLEFIREAMAKGDQKTSNESLREDEAAPNASIYFIADLVAFGTVTTSHTLMIRGESDSREREMIIGEGYVNEEVVLKNYSALHDIVVGLICFDVIFLSVEHLGLLHDLIGSSALWTLVDSESIRLVAPPPEPSVIFPDKGAFVGDLGVVERASKIRSAESFGKMSLSEKIRGQIGPLPGKESEAESHIITLERSTVDMAEMSPSIHQTHRTRNVLMLPSIRSMLGISDGTPRGVIPRWVVFPILRLARVIRNGIVCQHIQACATRMIWGTEKLATVAFSASAGSQWVDDAASYALSGRFNSDLGAVIQMQPSLLDVILRFRDSAAGVNFRSEITECLKVNEGSEIAAAINSGLRQSLSTSVLEQARDQLSGFFTLREAGSRLFPAFWGDLRNADERIARWRRVSKSHLENICRRNRIGQYDTCPCGSGEKLKFCCGAALR